MTTKIYFPVDLSINFSEFYTDISSCILNNGWSSGFFELGRGVRQGCPLSPYLFLIGVEILATAIRENKNIKGISIGIEEGKISQYADDSTLILDGSQLSLGEALDVLDTFSNISGLKVNYDKTEALWIGALRKNPKTYFPNRPIQWSNSKVKALGISFSANIPDIARVNYKEKLEKIKNVLNSWQFRRLTLLGKITVIKSLAVSQLVYVLSSLETCVEVIDEVNTLLYNFLWDGKGDKVKRTIMINDYEQGGLKMIDLKTFNKALKISWLQKYFDPKNKSKWKLFLEKTVEKSGGELVFSGFLKKEDIVHLDIESPFYKEILEAWFELSHQAGKTNENTDIFSQQIWLNSDIRIDRKPVFYSSWAAKGVNKIKHILDDNNKFLNFQIFTEMYDIQTDFLSYYGIVNATQLYLKKCKVTNQLHNNKNEFLKEFCSAKKICKFAYTTLLKDIQTEPTKCKQKWTQDLVMHDANAENINWNFAFSSTFKITKETKLLNFQFKFLHRRITTNSFLFKIGRSQSNKCYLCNSTQESLIHLFWECAYVQSFWKKLHSWLNEKQKTASCLAVLVVLGLQNLDNDKFNVEKHIFLLGRFFIYMCKMQAVIPTFEQFKPKLRALQNIEQQIAIQKGDLNHYVKKWKNLSLLPSSQTSDH